jgi:hypothetical protein
MGLEANRALQLVGGWHYSIINLSILKTFSPIHEATFGEKQL